MSGGTIWGGGGGDTVHYDTGYRSCVDGGTSQGSNNHVKNYIPILESSRGLTEVTSKQVSARSI